MPIAVAPVIAKNGVQLPTIISATSLATDSSGNVIAATGGSQAQGQAFAFFLS